MPRSLRRSFQFSTRGHEVTPRLGEFGCLGNDAVRQGVGVCGVFAGPAALRAVRSGRFGFGLGFHAPQHRAGADLFTAVRAFHLPEINPAFAYETARNQSSPLPETGERMSNLHPNESERRKMREVWERGHKKEIVRINAAENMDWQQVVLNGGPPCFHLDPVDGHFCGRAQLWHCKNTHDFISLADLLRQFLK